MSSLVAVPTGRFQSEDFIAACNPEHLVYFLLNVGDGDGQLVLLPADRDGRRRALVVDVATYAKLAALVDTLAATPLLPEVDRVFAVVVATHPHDDHIRGIARFLDRYKAHIAEFWEPGYYHPSGAYVEMMRAVEDSGIGHLQPSAGMRRYLGQVRLTVLSPGVYLRNRFDTYGIDINNASLSLKLEFPASRVEQTPLGRAYVKPGRTQSIILGADAQTQSWAQVMIDFPELRPDLSEIAKALSKRRGTDWLRAQVFKVPHHASKHGLSLELVEAINPGISLVSSVDGGGKYNFPHAVTLEALREGVDPKAASGKPHENDYDLGIHYTSGRDTDNNHLGSIALIYPPKGAPPTVWRLGDAPEADIDLGRARRFEATP